MSSEEGSGENLWDPDGQGLSAGSLGCPWCLGCWSQLTMGEKQIVLQHLAHLWDGPACEPTKWACLDLTEQPLSLSWVV